MAGEPGRQGAHNTADTPAGGGSPGRIAGFADGDYNSCIEGEFVLSLKPQPAGSEPRSRERIDQIGADLPPGRYLVPLSGASMEPILSDGDKLLVDVPARDPAFGDVLLVRHESVHYVHRLVGRSGGRLRTKGDGRGHMDGWLTESGEILGLVVGASHGGRWRDLRGTRCRLLCVLTGVWSAVCGHLYRVALRLDRAMGAGDGIGRGADPGPEAAAGEGFCADIGRLNDLGFRLIEPLHRRVLDHECCQSAVTDLPGGDPSELLDSRRAETAGTPPAVADTGADAARTRPAGRLGRVM